MKMLISIPAAVRGLALRAASSVLDNYVPIRVYRNNSSYTQDIPIKWSGLPATPLSSPLLNETIYRLEITDISSTLGNFQCNAEVDDKNVFKGWPLVFNDVHPLYLQTQYTGIKCYQI
jgi:hypothetical protein